MVFQLMVLHADKRPGRDRRRWCLGLLCTGLGLGLAPLVVAAPPSGAATTSSGSRTATSAGAAATVTASTHLTLTQWKQSYEHDIGILADDVLVVVDDGKRAQTHVTTAKVKTTLKDCRQWATDAALARSAAPPIPMASAQRAWASMIGASSRAAAQCVASLQTGAGGAKNFRKQLALVEKDEATLVSDLNG
jgi:hypothetical protein